jgi:hypothetical protein
MRRKRLVWVAVVVVLLVVLPGASEATWNNLEGRTEILTFGASPTIALIKDVVRQVASLLVMAVAIVIGLPLIIAGIAVTVSRLPTYLRRLFKPSSKHASSHAKA